MPMTRRTALGMAGAAVAAAAAGLRPLPAAATPLEAAIERVTRGAVPVPERVRLQIPDVAENGYSVPVDVSVDAAMADGDRVVEIALFAGENPEPLVATMQFGPLAGTAAVTTRIRLARTQTVIAVARMADGRCFEDRKAVTVIVGGCGA